ncbi:MAG TPA: hypothetical protein VEX68_03825 [Bryobacteraceae bacterium]|nr:hypothetical protein [Bryobacteraceae bacterium]
MPRSKPEVRSIIAVLCLAIILLAAWYPAACVAILLPIVIWIGFVWSGRDVRRTVNPHPQLVPFLAILPSRAPPALL